MPVVKITKQGRADIKAIYRYTVKEWGKQQAEDYKKALADSFKSLSASPKMGRLRPEIAKEIRSFPGLKHIIYFREIKGGIAVVRILHHAMDSEKAMKKCRWN